MYRDFYNLKLKPFQISTDPKFLWLGEKHEEALAVLKYGILDNKGFLLLTGDVGTGKTTLLNALIDSLGDDVLVAMVPDPGLGKLDFFNFIADSFQMDKRFRSKGAFLIYLRNYLFDLNERNKQTLLIIDECQQLTQKLLEEVRLLSNIEKHNTKLINIFFVGQSEFNDIILRPRNRALRQRITINYHITALSEAETDQYIHFRLGVAGSDDTIFTSGAIEEIYKFSNGYPRLINIICDQALLTGFVKEKKYIDEKIVAECAKELKIPRYNTISDSKATPEAGDSRQTADVTPMGATTSTHLHPLLQLKKPLLIALVVVFVIWTSLVAAYIFTQYRSPIANGAMDKQAGFAETSKDNTDLVRSQESESIIKSQRKDATLTSSVEKKPSSKTPKVGNNIKGETSEPSTASTGGENLGDRLSLGEIIEKFGQYPEVKFGFNSNKLEDGSYEILGLVAQFCIQNPNTIIILRGYTDNSGIRAYNMKLSEFRADMVKSYLVGRGVQPANITTIGMGPENNGPAGTKSIDDDSGRKVVLEIAAPEGN